MRLQAGREGALRPAITSCRKGGTVVIRGVFIGLVDTGPLGSFMNKGLTLRATSSTASATSSS
jgi:threonine dehydrogenase-like Zn-dependent dehydrogenase